MSKSYWLKEQRGNFSNEKNDTFDPKKKYVGIRLQQGVPLLDRDWNEKEDIRRHEEEMLHKWYIGNGTPDDGFKVSACRPPVNDFKITAGRCMVEGLEAVNEPENSEYILYSEQEGVEELRPTTARKRTDRVYLDVWIEEVTKAEDAALENLQDIGVETCVRHRLEWRVRVEREGQTHEKEEFHRYYDIAVIKRAPNRNTILDSEIEDSRNTNLALHHLRNETDSLLNSSIADELHKHSKLVGSGGSPDPALSVDNSGNIGIGTTSPGAKLEIVGFTNSQGICVNDAANTGVKRGLWLWNPSDSNHVIYSASPSGKSPANRNATRGHFNSNHRLRLRTAGGQGFLFENNSETALVDIDAAKGNIWTKGAIHCGNSDIYFTKTDHNHTGIGNTSGYAAIENATNYGALMILGRAGTSKGRYVRLWDYLQINGSMDITGNLGVGGAPSSHKLDVWGSARMNLLTFHGVGGNSGVGPQNYAIYQEAGPWSNPYPDLVIGYHTGIKIGGHRYYHGTRFYNDAPGRTGAAEIMSVGKADNNVRVNHSLFVESLTKTNILHIGGKWRLSGVGDAHANDGWLRLFNQANTDYYGGFAAGSLWSRSTGTLSDSFLKKNVETLNCSLKKLTSLRGIRFKWKDSKYDSSSKFGLIAQEVEPIFPELVSIGPDRMKSIDYSGFVAPIVEGIKEQQNQILKLSTDNQEQQKKIDLLISKKAGNDLAEYFESVDGKAIPFGISVVLDGDKIRKAKKSETPIGVISANPGNVSGVYFEWPKKYLNDEFGNLIMDAYQEEIMIPKKKKIKSERQKMKKKKISEEVKKTDIVLKKGKYCQKEIKEKVMSEIEEPVFKEADLYDAAGKKKMGKHKIPVMEIYEEEINVFDEDGQPVLVGSGKFETKNRPKLNPKYNESKKYISRENRPEWNCVGLLGQIPLRKGQPVAPSWIKIKDISKKVELWLVK